MFNVQSKTSGAILSVISNVMLVIMKFIVGFITGSVSVVSEGMHSLIDLLAALLAFFSIKLADKPPDDMHPYGHEKIENISGVIEALLIVAASGWIIWESVHRMVSADKVEKIGLGLIVMVISSIVNWLVAVKLYKICADDESVALEADALHHKADVYTSVGVALGLFVLWITNIHFLDPLVAIVIAIIILKDAYELLIQGFHPLVDTGLSSGEIGIIKDAISEHKFVNVDFHELRTRKSGKIKHIDLHLTIPPDMAAMDAHALCDSIEMDIEAALHNTKVLIHVEPGENLGSLSFPLNNGNGYNTYAGNLTTKGLRQKMEKLIEEVAPDVINVHHFHVHRYDSSLEVTLHVSLPESINLKEAHKIATNIEQEIRNRLSIEATIHTEPL